MLEFGRVLEVRREARALAGTLLTYGEISGPVLNPNTGEIVRERIDAGSFRLPQDGYLNLMHNPSRVIATGLSLSDSPERLELRAELNGTADADEALRLVDEGKLTGLSAEFRVMHERDLLGVRNIRDAQLEGAAVVDAPGYESSRLERRQALGTARAQIPLGEPLACECHRSDDVSTVRFAPGAFDDVIDEINRNVLEVIAMAGDAKTGTLGSAAAGTLRLARRRNAIGVEVDLPDTPTGQTIRTLIADRSANILLRPLFDQQASDFGEADGIADYRRLALTGILVGASRADAGWPAAVFAARGRRRRRVVV